ncbi:MAG: hypothetical protein L6R38_000194 [Xanthoria sp. 2 TBL-2021]|nr:MAG: hypothetical protein L6R38_000194 [Xanthoria sp. 2 TBL-2021]
MAALVELLTVILGLLSCSSAALLPQSPLVPSPNQQFISPQSSAPLPLVVWHGLGDNYKADGLRSVGEIANATNPGTYTYFIRLDDDPSSDRTATFLGNVTEQVSKVCRDLAAHDILSKASAINALGFSQGGQFLRAYVERCNRPPVHTLVTFGSQHNGISEFQNCGDNDWVCQSWDGYLKRNTWSHFVQSRLVPAQYYRDPEDLQGYLENSNFLADINNERAGRSNATYKENLKMLHKFVMYMFSEDVTVVPKESAWFADYNKTSQEITWLKERRIYKEDWLGLKWLDEKKRLELKIAKGKHMQLSEELLSDTFKQYFGANASGNERVS